MTHVEAEAWVGKPVMLSGSPAYRGIVQAVQRNEATRWRWLAFVRWNREGHWWPQEEGERIAISRLTTLHGEAAKDALLADAVARLGGSGVS